MSNQTAAMRWDPYVLARDSEFESFWRRHLASRDRKILLILGRGFDLRALETAKRLKAVGARAEVLLLAFENKLDGFAQSADRTKANLAGLIELFGDDAIRTVEIATEASSGGTATSRSTKKALYAVKDFDRYTDVVVDVSEPEHAKRRVFGGF